MSIAEFMYLFNNFFFWSVCSDLVYDLDKYVSEMGKKPPGKINKFLKGQKIHIAF